MDLSHLSYLAPAILVPVLLRQLLQRKRAEAAREGGADVMRYGAPWRGAVWVGAAAGVACALLPLFVPVKPDERWIMAALPAGFLALTALLALEVYGLRFRLGAQGIERHSPWRRAPLFFPWAELAGVSYLPGSQMLELRHRDGRCMNVSQYLQGFATLQALLERHAPPGALSAAARQQLRALH